MSKERQIIWHMQKGNKLLSSFRQSIQWTFTELAWWIYLHIWIHATETMEIHRIVSSPRRCIAEPREQVKAWNRSAKSWVRCLLDSWDLPPRFWLLHPLKPLDSLRSDCVETPSSLGTIVSTRTAKIHCYLFDRSNNVERPEWTRQTRDVFKTRPLYVLFSLFAWCRTSVRQWSFATQFE